jgi:hypothetical protein
MDNAQPVQAPNLEEHFLKLVEKLHNKVPEIVREANPYFKVFNWNMSEPLEVSIKRLIDSVSFKDIHGNNRFSMGQINNVVVVNDHFMVRVGFSGREFFGDIVVILFRGSC